jgi:hypothetical protein
MIKWETIKREFNTRYVIRSKKGNYLTENDGWTKKLKNAFKFKNSFPAFHIQEIDFRNCKVIEVKLFTLQAIEEIGEVAE